MLLDDKILDEIFKNNQNSVEDRIYNEYHERIKNIKSNVIEERENIKQGIIAELYYKEGFKDGVEFFLKYFNKK